LVLHVFLIKDKEIHHLVEQFTTILDSSGPTNAVNPSLKETQDL